MVNIFNLQSESHFFGPKYKILFVAAEAAPFVQVGGLGRAVSSLSQALKKMGQDVRIMIPRYLSIDQSLFPLKMAYEGLKVPTDTEGTDFLICNVKKYEGEEMVRTYFLENMEYYEKRANVYGYADDPVRWALLCRGTLEFLKRSDWLPDVIVACDWMAGFLPNYLKTVYGDEARLSKIATVFSIHNIAHQSIFDHHFVSEMDFDAGQEPIAGLLEPRLLKLNGMRRGIMYATVINTVSPTYAQEILTPEYGQGLHELLKARRARLYGILNGIDYKIYNPEKNSYIPVPYNSQSIFKREKNQAFLQKHFGLPIDQAAFVIGMVSRLDEQKGFDLVMEIADHLLTNINNLQMIILGDGDNKYKNFFQELAERYPRKVGVHFIFDDVLPHLIFSGSDIVLIPSKFEPCGLTQMEAMQYGAIPVVRKTGGLADTVENFNPEANQGTGFVFEGFDRWALFAAVIRAEQAYRHKKSWDNLVKRAMEMDFSWEASAREYLHLFSVAVQYHKKENKNSQ
ncbi:MAG: starch synthase [Parcubacteria group bacterium LiPW_39]|nr:MAG: starch synthase [Parcubacteria group bacterium LiPW_39]